MKRSTIVAAAALTGCQFITSVAMAADKLPKQARALLAMTPDDFARTAAVKDDELEVTATITTEPGFKETHGLLKIVWSDNFLRAFINNKTGATTYQLYQRIYYTGSGWRHYGTANYETPDGPKAVVVTQIGQDVDCANSRIMGGCTYAETVGFDVDESLLKTIASLYQPNVAAGWKFRFKSQAGVDYNDGLAPAEAAGLLKSVTSYRAEHRLPA